MNTIKAVLSHLSLWTSAVIIRLPDETLKSKPVPHTLVAFTPAGMAVYRYKSKDTAMLFHSLLRLMSINSKVFPVDTVH